MAWNSASKEHPLSKDDGQSSGHVREKPTGSDNNYPTKAQSSQTEIRGCCEKTVRGGGASCRYSLCAGTNRQKSCLVYK